jgi:hypothetical protein
MMKFASALLALSAPAALFAQAAPKPTAPSPKPGPAAGAIAINSETFIVQTLVDAKGQKTNKLFPAKRVVPGNVLVVKFSYTNSGAAPASNFAVNAKVDSALEVTDIREKWAVVSVDGGKVFGPLVSLKAKGADGKPRAATTKDITNIRWTLAQPVPSAGAGNVMYYGIVR